MRFSYPSGLRYRSYNHSDIPVLRRKDIFPCSVRNGYILQDQCKVYRQLISERVQDSFFNLTFLTSPAFLCIRFWDSLADNSHIIQIRLYTVIWTSANCDLEFVREYHIVIAYIKRSWIFLLSAKVSIRPYWQVVPLHETTGRTLAPVPPVIRPCSPRKAIAFSILL